VGRRGLKLWAWSFVACVDPSSCYCVARESCAHQQPTPATRRFRLPGSHASNGTVRSMLCRYRRRFLPLVKVLKVTLGSARDASGSGVTEPASEAATSAAGDSGPRFAQVRARNTYSLVNHPSLSGCEHHTVTASRRGPNRERARRAILTLLERARTQQHQVTFTVTLTDGTQLRLGGKGGYDPDQAITQCRLEADDPYVWLKDQLAGRNPAAAGTIIVGVDLDTWPTPAA
jgi:hypothetical protein